MEHKSVILKQITFTSDVKLNYSKFEKSGMAHLGSWLIYNVYCAEMCVINLIVSHTTQRIITYIM